MAEPYGEKSDFGLKSDFEPKSDFSRKSDFLNRMTTLNFGIEFPYFDIEGGNWDVVVYITEKRGVNRNSSRSR